MPNALDGLTAAAVNDTLFVFNGWKNYVLSLYCTYQYFPLGYGTVPPTISITFPQYGVSNQSSVLLSFTVDKVASWKAYSLDGQANITVAGDVNMTGLTTACIM
jgi:hypothetical protein